MEAIGNWITDDHDADGRGIASAQKEQPKEADPFQKLGLSADQRTKLDAAKNERMAALSATQQKVMGIRQRLMTLMTDKKAPDRGDRQGRR
ncbi:MAG: hypothetical protein M5R38_12635 [Candidatus Methylomirabilis sp.]|nr:hypothetical protein [Candidatus Methylomirabilis sp.]